MDDVRAHVAAHGGAVIAMMVFDGFADRTIGGHAVCVRLDGDRVVVEEDGRVVDFEKWVHPPDVVGVFGIVLNADGTAEHPLGPGEESSAGIGVDFEDTDIGARPLARSAPMTEEQLARAIGVDQSTVSRVFTRSTGQVSKRNALRVLAEAERAGWGSTPEDREFWEAQPERVFAEDVAYAAGVTRSTVVRVRACSPLVSKATARRVLAAADELGYPMPAKVRRFYELLPDRDEVVAHLRREGPKDCGNWVQKIVKTALGPVTGRGCVR